MAAELKRRYRPTESKYKDGARKMYVTYDVEQKTRGSRLAAYPKVKRVYIAGAVKGWKVGDFEKRTGKRVHGVKVDYEQSRQSYQRKAYRARRGGTEYEVSPAKVGASKSRFSRVVEVPESARNVRFHQGALPERYEQALQDVR